MELDRHINPDGRGKYALINLRKDTPYRSGGSVSVKESAVVWGGDDQFFVIKYKDKFAAAALNAYATAVRVEVSSLRAQLESIRTDSVRCLVEEKMKSLTEYADAIDREARVAASWPNRRIPD